MQWKTILLALLLPMVAVAGCLGDDGGDSGDASPSPNGDGDGNQTLNPTVEFTASPPSTANASEAFNVTWRVDPGVSGEFNVTETSVYWSNQSVSDPDSPQEYGNTSSAHTGTIPAEFSTNLTFDQADTYYLRAHAFIDGNDHFSEEFTVEVVGVGTVHEVTIEPNAVVGDGAFSSWEPATLEINVGDAVVWNNTGDTAAHSSVSDDGQSFTWATVTLEPGDTSEPVVFTEPGEFTYHCGEHPDTMTGYTIVVS